MKIKYILPLLTLLILQTVAAQESEYEPFRRELERILHSMPPSTDVSVMVYKPETDDTVYARQITKSMIPASNTKLFTTAAALRLMGPDYILKTSLMTDDLLFSEDTIRGNLYVKGFGNPVMDAEDIDSLARSLAQNGLKVIEGDVLGDDSYFDKNYTRDDWITGERANVHLPPVSALVTERNQVILRLYSNTGAGNKLGYRMEPENMFASVDMDAIVSGKWRSPRISRADISSNGIRVRVSGGLRSSRYSKSWALDIDDPELYAAFLFYDRLKKHGVKIMGRPGKGKAPANAFEIGYTGVRLDKLVALINKHSDNYLAECLFKTVGAYYSAEEGNSFYATQAVLTFIDEYGIFGEGTAVVDGSGISRFNEITVGAITGLLTEMFFSEDIFNEYYNSLSSAGVDGTLRKRMRRTAARGNFHGKTGTLRSVTACSGYLRAQSGDTVIVSIIMEYKTKGGAYHKGKEDDIVVLAEKML